MQTQVRDSRPSSLDAAETEPPAMPVIKHRFARGLIRVSGPGPILVAGALLLMLLAGQAAPQPHNPEAAAATIEGLWRVDSVVTRVAALRPERAWVILAAGELGGPLVGRNYFGGAYTYSGGKLTFPEELFQTLGGCGCIIDDVEGELHPPGFTVTFPSEDQMAWSGNDTELVLTLVGVWPGTVVAEPHIGTTGQLTVTSDVTLDADHRGTVTIGADNVTLDCAGYEVTSASAPEGVSPFFGGGLTPEGSRIEIPVGGGIEVGNYSNVTIMNCVVRGFDAGIRLRDANNNTIANNTVSGNRTGILLEGSRRNDLVGNTATRNIGVGIYLSNSNRNTLTDNYVAGGIQGIILTRTKRNTVTGNTVVETVEVGLGTDRGRRNTFTNNIVDGVTNIRDES